MERRLTARPMKFTSLRFPETIDRLILEAAAMEGISRSEFIRRAMKERAERILPMSIREGAQSTKPIA